MEAQGTKQNLKQRAPSGGRLLFITRGVVRGFFSDRCSTLAASIAFYSAFSLAPTLLIVLAIVGWFFGRDTAQGRLVERIKDITGPGAADAMRTMVEHAHYANGNPFAAALSLVLLLVGASATFSSLNTALNAVFKVEPPRGISGIELLLRARLVSVSLVMGFGFLLVVSLMLDIAIQAVGQAVLGTITIKFVALGAQTVFGLLVMTVGYGAFVKWLPDVEVGLRNALIGAA